MTTPAPVETLDLATLFPGFISKDTRSGYSGWIVDKQHLVEFAYKIREEYGYDLLTSVTGVDYYPDDRMEVVYHAFKTIGGPVLNFKVQVPRQDPIEVPSLISIYPGVELQEREIWDLFGIIFTGHPDLRRILMWEGFAGHPLRKDWKEAYFEEESKPFKSRWPEGRIIQAGS